MRVDGESEPDDRLPEVVSARNLIEAPAIGNISLSSSRFPQVPESDMAHQVHELSENENCDKDISHGFIPAVRRVLGVHEEVEGEPAEEDPVVSGIFENVRERHSVV